MKKLIDKAPELLFEMDKLPEPATSTIPDEPEIAMELIRKMVQWDRTNKRLKPHDFKLMFEIMNDPVKLIPQNKKYCLMNYHFISKWGFRI